MNGAQESLWWIRNHSDKVRVWSLGGNLADLASSEGPKSEGPEEEEALAEDAGGTSLRGGGGGMGEIGGLTRALFFPHSLPSSSPTFTLEPLHEFRQSTGARGKAVMRAAAADQAGNDGLEGGVRGKLLGVRCNSRFYRGLIAFLRFCSEDLGVNIG
ncbi:hypothetical protein Taro_047679 [Colocasia esculenta]|uniref:Uncharacterized protein n=1 Tax=Colocasia esculenta TaxID=4460 RepID=A0A843X7C5_COLES|nr:hypothetical protein [Colocasia esculenta]